ncbi:MAG: malonate transporter subunit MadL [Flavobacteriales bacterium TMED235]|nr:MAG: malonate transporter subunit MadL [Flavobacteriales bacterium TMED235]|tara:strand:- start:1623 stop:1991 length:369 start_codon:yes stop_codon:yes gene_type:complete
MKIYGVALLAFCFLIGKLIGNYLGILIGLKSDVGGVGFAMLFLMLSYSYFKKKGLVKEMTAQGILFWSSMYLPIIIAMAATQNVKAAISQGPIAVVIGVVVTITGFLLVPLITKIGQSKNKN